MRSTCTLSHDLSIGLRLCLFRFPKERTDYAKVPHPILEALPCRGSDHRAGVYLGVCNTAFSKPFADFDGRRRPSPDGFLGANRRR